MQDWDLVTFNNSYEAFNYAEVNNIDIFLSGYRSNSNINGIQVLDKVKKMYKNIKTYLITGFPGDLTTDHKIIKKPFQIETIIKELS